MRSLLCFAVQLRNEVNYSLGNLLTLAEHVSPITEIDLPTKVKSARETLDVWVREMVDWHFSPETGCPFWIDYAKKLGCDPRREIHGYADLARLGLFQDEWMSGWSV